MQTLNLILAIVLGALAVAIWFTASQVLSVIFLVVAVVFGLNITGVLGSLFGKKNV